VLPASSFGVVKGETTTRAVTRRFSFTGIHATDPPIQLKTNNDFDQKLTHLRPNDGQGGGARKELREHLHV
jgi:hypothetical protein